MAGSVIISRRFCGPPESGNGGYSCGVVGSRLDGASEVTLRRPPPLDRPMDLSGDGARLTLEENGQLVAEGVTTKLDLEAPPPPTFEEATAASARYPWREKHPYPTCFVCGPARTPRDGMCLFPGPMTGRDLAAAPFVPDETLAGEDGRVRPEIMWAALDCPSWFGFQCFHPFDGMVLLGRLAARIHARPRVGERCVSVGWSLGREGRKIRCGSALYAPDGALLALGQATWIVLK